MEKNYMKEIEAIAKKFDYWDESKSPYAFLVSYENDNNAGVTSKFITKRMKGGNAFRECIQKMIHNFTPDVIIIEEFTGVKGNALSQYPTRIRTREGNTNAVPIHQMEQPRIQQQSIESMFEGLSGLEGFEGVKNGLGAILAFERERHTKDMMIDRLTYDQKFREMEMKNEMAKLQERVELLSRQNDELSSSLKHSKEQIGSLEDENDELREENERYKPHKMFKEVGINALTNVAMQLATKSPSLRGILGLEDEPTGNQTPTAPANAANLIDVDESTLSEGQKKTMAAIKDIAQALTTWPVPHLERFIKIMAFIEDNEERQLDLVDYIKEQIEQQA